MPSGQAVKWLTSSEESEAANPTRTHLPAAPDMRQLWPNPLKACSLSIPVSSTGWGGRALPCPICPQRESLKPVHPSLIHGVGWTGPPLPHMPTARIAL